MLVAEHLIGVLDLPEAQVSLFQSVLVFVCRQASRNCSVTAQTEARTGCQNKKKHSKAYSHHTWVPLQSAFAICSANLAVIAGLINSKDLIEATHLPLLSATVRWHLWNQLEFCSVNTSAELQLASVSHRMRTHAYARQRFKPVKTSTAAQQPRSDRVGDLLACKTKATAFMTDCTSSACS